MTELHVVSIEEVRALVAERQRYDDWLTALEAKREDTPPRVFARVHGDYLGRRSAVITRLQTHVGGLATLGDELEQRLADLEAKLGGHEDELAEGMLRNLVGEYDGDRWETVRQEIEAKIAELNEQRGTLLAECDDVRTLLASARVVPEPMADTASELPAAEATAHGAEATEADGVGASTVLPAADQPSADAWDAVMDEAIPDDARAGDEVDLGETADTVTAIAVETVVEAVEETVVEVDEAPLVAPVDLLETPAHIGDAGALGDDLLDIDVSAMMNGPAGQAQTHEEVLADVAALFDTSSITAVPAPDATTAIAVPPSPTQEFDDALAMFGETSGDADPHFVQSLQGIEAEHDTPAAPTPDADPFDDLAFLRSVIDPGGAAADVAPAAAPAVTPPAASAAAAHAGGQGSGAPAHEPQKTLRCTECGTMNLPTEWYCERCGGELAAF